MKNGTALLWRIALLTLGLSSPALAVDGMLEINQACAVSIGCFSGDAAGLPVTITAAGSYLLTSNLTVPDENTDGILVSANDVGIDLNNFAIIGPVTCTGLPLTCTHTSGTGDGIVGPSAAFTNTSVRNGSVTGMGNHGVSLGEQAEVTDLRVRSNRSNGIYVQTGSTVLGNTARSNTGYGLNLSADTGYSGNVVSGNTGGTVSGTAVQFGQNACNGNTTCP